MATSARSERARLNACLKKLAALKLSDLAREDLGERGLSFRGGLSYFEKTLGLFDDLQRRDLRRIRSSDLTILADHGERVLAQFDEIMRFTGDGIEDPAAVRSHLIGEVRDSYGSIRDDIALMARRPASETERGMEAPWYSGMPLAMALFVALAGCAYVAYRFTPAMYFAHSFMSSLRELNPQQ
jgi:hypothetical protein